MRPNVGTIDRVARLVLGLGLTSLAFVGPKTPWGYLGLIFVATSAISFCPIYRVLGLSTKS